ncbi:MAG: putative PLP-dependent enzyme involved in cell wall biosis [Mucilaginibacter sp.]|nr:putative PLP-dependent enzyme involved in cell wall biosis [Mucilaginibacter sp.]
MNIPFVDLKAQYLSIKEEIDQAIANVINETAFIGGSYVKAFESSFAQLYGVKHCIGVGNGTDSLFILMKMLGIGIDDEVITTAYSWISSSETISQTGAKPVFVDIDEYFTMSAADIESKITQYTKAIIPVHIHGQMCDMDAIIALSQKYNLHVIEDCAQSHFSELNGRRAGTIGIAGSFSFYPGKNLGAYGDAGCILTNDDALAEKCRMFANHGALKKHQHLIEGINSRLDGLQAGILSAKLPFIVNWTQKRRHNASLYDQYLQNIQNIELPKVRKDSRHSYHLYVIKAERRDELKSFLNDNGIETVIHYPTALPNMECYKYLGNEEFPVSTANQSKILSLPMFPELKETDIQYIASKIHHFYSS